MISPVLFFLTPFPSAPEEVHLADEPASGRGVSWKSTI